MNNIFMFIRNLSSDWKIAIFSAVITSLISILGIYLTIKHNNKITKIQIQRQEEEYKTAKRLEILPYIKYDLIDTLETSHLGHQSGGASFFPFGFINGGNGPVEKFYSKMKIIKKLLVFKNIGKNPCVYFRVLEFRTEDNAEVKSYKFPFEISFLEVNETSDMFIQSGIPIELPQNSKFLNYEEIPQNFYLYLDICYVDMLGNYYEQTITFLVFANPIIYTDLSQMDFKLDMRIANTTIPKFIKGKNIFKDKPPYLNV